MQHLNELNMAVCKDVERHCIAKGYREGYGVNNFIPHDAIAAFGMARLLADKFDHYVAIAPEGHIYGYFLERLGTTILAVFVDSPPTNCTSDDDLSVLEERRVLLIEDDVISGKTLQLVVDHLRRFSPASLSLYLGHSIGVQHVGNVPKEIASECIYVAEHALPLTRREKLGVDFTQFFAALLRQ